MTRLAAVLVSVVAAACAGLISIVSDAHAQRRGGTPGDFDFYVLALSWSPGFCELSGRSKGREQCDIGARKGFVVHGLWPQYHRGFPSDCGMDRSPTRMAMEAAKGVFPDEQLARYEWRKHGTCSGLSPQAYFDHTRDARDRVTIPETMRNVTRDLVMDPREIERAFIAANPGLRADMVAISCRRQVLQEVRVCMSKDVRGFIACPDVGRNECRSTDITIPAMR
ncbi:MAG: ribonuclease T2 family protein [Beijerinckiaceae bacterium]